MSAARETGTEPTSHGRAAEDYLKAIYKLQEADRPVATSDLADELDRSAASVTSMVKSLASRGLLAHVPYRGFRLTAVGVEEALRIIRRHRVLEAYLTRKLGYDWDGVHEEAERLEHAASDELVNRMARAVGEPEFDPHGAPIPGPDGRMEECSLLPLRELPPGTEASVSQVADEDPDRLRRAAALGLVPGARLEVCGPAKEGGRRLRVAGREVTVEEDVVEVIRVELRADRGRVP